MPQRRATETGTLAAVAALRGGGQLPLGRVMLETDAPFMCPDKAWLPPGAGFARKVRQTPSWPRSWANFHTLQLYGCIPTGMHGPACIVWANLTHFSVEMRVR